MNFTDPSMALLAASGGDTVKLFDVSDTVKLFDTREPVIPCTLIHTPSPRSLVNSVKWNHTNLVVASAGEDKKISLWRKNGQSMGTIPAAGTDSGNNVEESIMTISFSNKESRYICFGGSGQVVRIWDLQRKRCIKWLRGHTNTITGAMYNCKDEHLASISLNGDLILHNLASGARAAELKDPNDQVLRVLDYSRISQHLLVTAGDDGSVHLWDTTGLSPKVSWLKQHSAPTAGVSFSPSNDKVIASVGRDKKLYTFDSGTRRPSFCIPYKLPFYSLAFRDDGLMLAAGTSNGCVVFYDVRGKPRPLTVLSAYQSCEAVTSLCWQRSKPVIVNENNCTAETALLGGAVEDSILMPDPLPSVTSSSLSISTAVFGSRNPGCSGPFVDSSSLFAASSGSTSNTLSSSAAEETSHRSTLWTGGSLTRLHAPWAEHEGAKKDHLAVDKKPSLLFPSSRRFTLSEEGLNDLNPIFDSKSSSTSKQLGSTRTASSKSDSSSITLPEQLGSTRTASSKSDSSITLREAWGGNKLSDNFVHHRQPVTLPPRFEMSTSSSLTSGSMFSGLQDLSLSTSQTSMISATSSGPTLANLRTRDTSNQETSLGSSKHVPFSSTSLSVGTKGITGQTNHESKRLALKILEDLERRENKHLCTIPSFSDGTSLSVGSTRTASSKSDSSSITLPEQLGSTRTASSKSDSSSITLWEAWGGKKLSDNFIHHRQPVTLPPRFEMSTSSSLTSGSMFSGLQDLSLSTSQMSMSSAISSGLSLVNLRTRDTSNQETSLGFSKHVPFSSTSLSVGTKGITGQANLESMRPALKVLEDLECRENKHLCTIPSFSDGTSLSVGSPKTKKTGAETGEELLHRLLSRSDVSSAMEGGILPSANGGIAQPQKAPSQTDPQQGTSYTLQLLQHTLDETLASVQKSIHEDIRNVHIEVLRQFHIHEMQTSNLILAKQADLMKEVQSLRKETQQLRQLL